MSVADEIQRLQQAKSDLATSIANKGVTVPSSATLDDYPALVDSIQQGGAPLSYDAEIEWLGIRQGVYVEMSDYVPTGNGISVDMVAEFISYPTTTSWAVWFQARVGGTNVNYRVARGDAANRLTFNGGTTDTYGQTLTNYTLTANKVYFLHLDNLHFIITPKDGSATSTNVSTNHSGTANTNGFVVGDPSLTRGININVKSFMVREYGTIVLDYIPVRVGTTGYMYDRVRKKLYGKAATCTTDFVLGNDKT